MSRVIHFEIPVDNPDRAIKFYGTVFGWKTEKWQGPSDYWMVSTGEGPGINGGFLLRKPGMSVVNTVDVASLDDSIKLVEKSGGAIVLERMAIPGVGYLAYGKDPDGNIFGMMQADAKAV